MDGGGRLGLITPLTNNFCDGCNRVRVTATGQLAMCLGNEGQVDLRSALRSGDPAALDAALDRAMRLKPERHAFVIDRLTEWTRGRAEPAAMPKNSTISSNGRTQ